jgi:hypothetical protein
VINIQDLEEVGVDPLIDEIGLDKEKAELLIDKAVEKSKEIAETAKKTKAQEVLTKEQDSKKSKKM